MTRDRVNRYIERRLAQGAAPATVDRETEVLSRAFRLAIDGERLSYMPKITRLRKPNAREGFVERAEFEAILEAVPDADLRDFLSWFFYAGMRPGETRSLSWDGFDRETWTLRLHARDAKIGVGRTFELAGALKGVIERRLAARLDCPLIFHSEGQPIDLRKMREAWKDACAKAKVVGRIPYDLRRTAIRNMIEAGVDRATAKAISGHRTDSVFDRYLIGAGGGKIRGAAEKLTKYVESLPLRPAAVVNGEFGYFSDTGAREGSEKREKASKSEVSDGGPCGTRTHDHRLKRPMLYRLS